MSSQLKKKVPDLRFPEFDGEWEEKRLGELAKVIDCKHRTPPYVISGIPVISPGTITWGELDTTSPVKRVSEGEYQTLMDHCEPKAGDLVFSRNQSIGVASIIREQTKFVLGQDTVLIQSDTDCSGFIYYRLQTHSIQSHIDRVSGGSTFSRINLKDIRKLPMMVVSAGVEQTKIAVFLSTVDGRIEGLEKKRELLKDYKKGLMQKLFNQSLRFMDENGTPFPDWEEKTLGKVADVIGGGTPDTTVPEYWGGNFQWFTPTEIKFKYLQGSRRTITEVGLKKSSAKVLPEGTLLFSSRATVGDVGIALQPCTTNQGFQSMIVRDGVSNEFLYYWIVQNKKQFIRRSSGSTFLEISKSEIQKIKMRLTQRIIATVGRGPLKD